MSWPKTEQEEKLDEIFNELDSGFRKLDKQKDATKANAILKDLTNKLKDAKTLIKEFEREGRTDGMPAKELADRKRALVNELNNFIGMKKQYGAQAENREQLFDGAGAAADPERGQDGMTTQEVMQQGRKEIGEIDHTLNRAEKVVEDTIQIGTQTAATLHDQTNQMNKIVDDLNDIEFTMKKASKIIRDITRGILTDKCIGFLLFIVVIGVVAIVVVKIIKPNKHKVKSSLLHNFTLPHIPGTGRRMLLEALQHALQEPDYELWQPPR